MSDLKSERDALRDAVVSWSVEAAELKREVERLEARVAELEAALRGLIRMNEEHNAAVETVIGRPLNWSDTYLDDARAALAAEKGEGHAH